jgi:seryl-tRNA synthetase
MLDVSRVRENPEALETALRNRGAKLDLSEFRRLDERRRALLKQVEDLRARRNRESEAIARLKKDKQDATAPIEAMRVVGQEISAVEGELSGIEESLRALLLGIPNIPHATVPVGPDATHNAEIRVWGDRPRFDFTPKPHDEVGAALGVLDLERAAKISGARFALSTGAGAKLERALINFMLDLHTREHGYREMLPPFLAGADALFGTGQLPKFETDLFKVEGRDLYLVPTAEVPLTNLHRDEVLEAGELPKHYTAYTPCFRSEAGSHGKDVRGLIRQHQFDKVELVKITDQETSFDELESLTRNAEEVLKRLGLPYRTVLLCTGDMGFASAKTYDIEVWLPSQNTYREISSCSNCADFQARRAKIRYRPATGGKPRLCHTLNGSGLAVGRTWLAILENYQNEDGSVGIPESLRPYLDGMETIVRS